METPQNASRRFAVAGLIFESGLIAVAVLIGWLLARWPLPGVDPSSDGWAPQAWAALQGGLAAVPMFLGLMLVDRYPWGPLRELQRTVDEKLLPLLEQWTRAQMALISLAAGFGEEMLFRGLLQTALTDLLPGHAGLVVAVLTASAVFGICHWITTGYAVLAGLMGVYLGILLVASGNLLVPIAAHAAYDFAALTYLLRGRNASALTGRSP
jgi:uncharacterized protein